MKRLLLSLAIFLLTINFIYAQCSSCDATVTVPDAGNYTPGNNKTICITGSGEFTGTINLDNANSILCIGEDVIFKGSLNINKSNTTINNYGTLELAWLSYSATFNNYGSVSITSGINVNSSGTFNNYNTTFGAVDINGDVNVDNGANFNTDGGIVVNGNFTANSGSDVTLNGAGLQISGTLTVDSGSDIVGSGTSGSCEGITYGSIVLNQTSALHDLDVCNSTDPDATNDVTFDASITTCDCSSLLPVTYVSYGTTADYSNNSVKVSWSTSSEVNSYSFEIEKSIDGYEFDKIGEVYAAGNTEAVTTYNFNDANPKYGKQYYRIKQLDVDGNYFYTEVMVQFYENRKSTSEGMLVAVDNANLQLSFDEYIESGSLEVIALSGKLIYQSEVDVNDYLYNLQIKNNLSSGIYIVRFRNLENYWVKKVMVD
ncbi:MAG: hypothetical protein CMO01_05620 [Thalassobius sp.]|nr:hypothetical protein [Thalassovita sp.]